LSTDLKNGLHVVSLVSEATNQEGWFFCQEDITNKCSQWILYFISWYATPL